jgi:hypothetical protein
MTTEVHGTAVARRFPVQHPALAAHGHHPLGHRCTDYHPSIATVADVA